MRPWTLIAALASVACSTTVRERQVIYVPMEHRAACPCPPKVARSRVVVPASAARDAVPRSYGQAKPDRREPCAKKPGRSRAKRCRPETESPAAEHARLPPGQAKRKHDRERAQHGNEQASWAKKKRRPPPASDSEDET